MSNIETNKQNIDCDLVSKIDQSTTKENKNKETKNLLLSAKKIIEKRWNNERIKKEYKDLEDEIIKSLSEIKKATSLECSALSNEIDKNEYIKIQKEYNELNNYFEADYASYSYNTDSFLKKEWKQFISNWKEIPNNIFKQIEKNSNIFFNWDISISELSNGEIWWMLSWVETLIENWDESYKDRLIKQLSSDPEWLIHLKNNWDSISTKLQFEAKLLLPLVNDIINSTQNAINIEIISFIENNNPEITENELKLILESTNTFFEKWSDIKDIINYLEAFRKNTPPNELLQFISRISRLDSTKRQFIKESALLQIKEAEALGTSNKEKEIPLLSSQMIVSSNLSNLREADSEILSTISVSTKSSKFFLDALKKGSNLTDSITLTLESNNDDFSDESRDKLSKLIKKREEIKKKIREYKLSNEKQKLNKEPEISEKEKPIENLSYFNQNSSKNSDWSYNLVLKNWREIKNIPKNEADIIQINDENLDNFLKFEETLKELNLGFIWNNRIEFISILNELIPTEKIEIDWKNYIDESELKKILNWIIVLTWNKKDNSNSLSSIKSNIRKISKSWVDDTKKDLKWSPIEKIFINKWIIDKNNSLFFFNRNRMIENYN